MSAGRTASDVPHVRRNVGEYVLEVMSVGITRGTSRNMQRYVNAVFRVGMSTCPQIAPGTEVVCNWFIDAEGWTANYERDRISSFFAELDRERGNPAPPLEHYLREIDTWKVVDVVGPGARELVVQPSRFVGRTITARTSVAVDSNGKPRANHRGYPVYVTTWGETITANGLDAAVGIMERWAFACQGLGDEMGAHRAMKIASLYAQVARA